MQGSLSSNKHRDRKDGISSRAYALPLPGTSVGIISPWSGGFLEAENAISNI